MKVNGTATLHGPLDEVWTTLRDPRVLVRTIPGCQRLETIGEDEYKMTVTAGVASIRGTYAGTVRLTDPRPPHSFVLRASAPAIRALWTPTSRCRWQAMMAVAGHGWSTTPTRS